jgi:quercetin dioxygenase-like cupin family protein
VAHAGQEIQGQDGFRLRLIRTAAETGGDLLEMEATYGGTGALPPEHFHPRQVEHFEVLEGNIRAIIDGTERQYGLGETFDVPAGTRHQMTADEPSRVRWEIRPALRTAEFFERLHAGGDIAALFVEFRDEIRLTALEEG